jgi:thiosulfate dehydrogenase
MSDYTPNPRLWAAGILFAGLAGFIGYTLPRNNSAGNVEPVPGNVEPVAARPDKPTPIKVAENSEESSKETSKEISKQNSKVAFSPPTEDEIPKNEFGDMVRLGEKIFHDTKGNAKEFVGNSLVCSNCHLDSGRLANAAPLWAAYVLYPTYRAKNGHVNTFEERLQDCFLYSMNGKSPASDDKVLVALESYAFFLAKGAPTGVQLPGRGYPKLAKPAKLDYAHGQQVYADKCAVCHGADGLGQSAADRQVVFPPLWGAHSFNWGAGMSSIENAAGFVKANMPLSQGNTLTDEEAWDVAAYIDSQERPQDPRFNGSVAETRKLHHDSPMDMYGQTVHGIVLGQNSPAAGPPR